VIHALGDEQDMRKMGGLVKLLPFTYSMMVLGSLALVGFPYLTGFYSKDVILEVAYAKYTLSGNFAYWLGTVSALLTSYYSFRLLYLTFLASPQMLKSSLKNVHDAPFLMGFSLCCLAVGSIFGGFMAKDMMIGLGTNFWGNALFTLPTNTLLIESEYIPQAVKFVPIIFSLLGALFAVNLNGLSSSFSYYLKTSFIGKQVYIFLNKRWLFDKVYNDFVALPSLNFGYKISFQLLDKGFLEMFGPTGIIQQSFFMRKFVKTIQTGSIYHYAFMMFVSLTLILAFFLLATTNVGLLFDSRILVLLFLSFFWLSEK
jgi:NADH-ubiquinone oxidoreductase chain 5